MSSLELPSSIAEAYDPERFRADGHELIDAIVARQLFARSLTLLPGDPAATNLLRCCGEAN